MKTRQPEPFRPHPHQTGMITVPDSHLHLVPVQPELHRPAIVEILSDADVRAGLLCPSSSTDWPVDYESVRKFEANAGHKTHFCLCQNGETIGALSFGVYQKKVLVEVGFFLKKSLWNQGVMTACLSAACEYAFREWEYPALYACVLDENRACIRVLEKCGFHRDCETRLKDDGKEIPAWWFVVVEEDFMCPF